MFTLINNLRIGVKISLGFGALLLIVLMFLAFSWVVFLQLEGQARGTLLEESEMVRQVGSMRTMVLEIQQQMTNAALARSPAVLAANQGEIQSKKKEVTLTLQRVSAFFSNSDRSRMEEVNKLTADFDTFMTQGMRFAQTYAGGRSDENLRREFNKTSDALLSSMESLNDDFVAKERRGMIDLLSALESFRYQSLMQGGAAFGLGLLLALIITRSITAPLTRLMRMIQDLTEGNLRNRMNLRRKDEIGRISRALDTFADNLQHEIVAAFHKLASGDLTFQAQGVIRQGLEDTNIQLNGTILGLRAVAEKLTVDSMSIYGLSQSISSAAEAQAASLQEISSTMADLNSRTRKTADNAKAANRSTQVALQEAQVGNNRMTEMVMAMGEISKSAEHIQDIIKVIDEIAFQTNLLALNAAVESGRAGAHGRGFAVVADEVRELAARSAQAAKETASLIADSVAKVQHGSDTATKTAESLGRIVGEISKSSSLMSEISTAASEQAHSINQIFNALSQIENITHTTSKNATEFMSAFENIAAQLSVMGEKLDHFHLRQSLSSPAPRAGGQPQLMGPTNAIALDEHRFGKY
ncbi:MAG: methyl-accepting chemotaxis protein [Deltaproteobacteria bacterium]|nr:methyl-accepting chemotaxis protein [Deltaproteobacteria bacterium]